eukprot:gene34219-biopygen20930
MDLVEVGVPRMEYIKGALRLVPDALSRRPDFKDKDVREGLKEAAVVVASAEVSMTIVEKMAAVELQLKEKLGADAKLLPADVGPHRAVRTGREQPWQALTSRQVAGTDGAMGDLPDRVEWGNQEMLSRVIKELIMPGHWHDGHLTILSRKCSE